MEAKLNPTKDSLFTESKDSPYANILAVRKGDENRPEIQKLMKALNSPEVKKFIEDKYKGAILPSF
jgi:D-methionine transport system substrate-binding protein